ncbi:MAG: hypothetical protein BIP78_0195 [Candidatus Bipolaricaulis sibiricus]|uniref:Uncharacterized protein n=1 Tax=Bipolaricaulis sibiricus TaxID=2501609 RepID=A0A410FSG4_BIPS1|nr:MAG: hypothetical protein BIP78_0195 [Candidatus Bipolaricaulis sibiricus]
MKIQHLVLDDDVHRALKARKKQVGITVKEIGNSALRAALALPTLDEMIVEKLVETGKITPDDYDAAVAAAQAHLRAAQRKAIELFRPAPGSKSVSVGSWTVREIYRSKDDSYAVFEHRARDGRRIAPPLHYHTESHVWGIVLSGKILARTAQEERVLGVHEWTYYPPGVAHCSAPLTRDTCVVSIVAPPERFDPGECPDPTSERPARTRRPNKVPRTTRKA